MLDSKPFSGAAKTGLGFIHDQQRFVLSGKVLERLHIARRRNDHSSCGNNWLDDDRGNIVGRMHARLKGTVQTNEITFWEVIIHGAMKAMRRENSI